MNMAWMRALALGGVVAFGAPMLTTYAQDKPEGEAKSADEGDVEIPNSAKEVFEAISNYARQFGNRATPEQNTQIWANAWKLVSGYAAANPDAEDVAQVYSWALSRAGNGLTRDEFLGMGKAYLAKWPKGDDAEAWKKNFIGGGLNNEKFKKEASDMFAPLAKSEGKSAAAALLVAEIRLLEAQGNRDRAKSGALSDAAWVSLAKYVTGNTKAADLKDVYKWAEARGGRDMSRAGYLTIAKSYLASNGGAKDARVWRSSFIRGGLKNDTFRKEAAEALDKLSAASKKEAASATLLAEIKMADAASVPRAEQAAAIEEAWQPVTDYLKANAAAKDLAEIYTWTLARAQQNSARAGFLTVASTYLSKNAGATDLMEWRRLFIQGGMRNETFRAEATDSRARLIEERKTDAAAAMLEIDLRLAEAEAAKDAEAMKSIAQEVQNNSLIAKSTDVWVRRDRLRILLSQSKAEIKVGEQFPCWSEVMAVQDLDGKDIKMADYKGKVVLIDFWAVWCGPCIGEMPHVVKAYNEFHDKGFDVIGISFDTRYGEGGLRETIKGEGNVGARTGVMPWRQIYDGGYWGSGFAKRYGVRGIPMTVLVGKDGKVVATDGLRDGELAKKLPGLLGLETAE